MSSFDRYLMVDWSSSTRPSSARPRRDAIWVGDLGAGETATHYCRTRQAATELLREILKRAVAEGQRVLVGFDFPFAYPAGFARAAGLDSKGHPPWLAIWDYLCASIHDGIDNRNNRFEVAAALNERVSDGPGPFWGCPKAKACATLTRTHKQHFSFAYEAPGASLERLRLTERHIKGGRTRAGVPRGLRCSTTSRRSTTVCACTRRLATSHRRSSNTCMPAGSSLWRCRPGDSPAG